MLETAVVSASDDEHLPKPKAYVVLKQGIEPTEALKEELIAFTKGKLPSYKAPRWIEFLGDLPKTATGKIQRFALREA